LYDYVLEDEQILAMYEQTKDSYIALDEKEEISIEELVAQIAAELAENNTSTELIDNTTTTETITEPIEPVNATTIEQLVLQYLFLLSHLVQCMNPLSVHT